MSADFRLPDTGLEKCYDRDGNEIEVLKPGDELYGQDGCFSVNPMSFTKLGHNGKELSVNTDWDDGFRMVRDNNTGLIWEVKSPNEDDVNYFDDMYSWEDAQKTYIDKLNREKYGGFNDWRSPNKAELRSIIDYSRTNPAVDLMYFPNCRVALYWCNVTYQMQPYFGWTIFFGFGSATATGKTSPRHVRAVRAGYSNQFGVADPKRFKDNNDGTITDTVTGLMWQKGENDRMSWYDAMKACREMKLAGHNDWRLPNIKELNTIVDLTYKENWWYYKEFFPAEGLVPPLLHYNSSTSHEGIFSWVKNFCFGYDGYYANKNTPLLFRAVRNIQKPAAAKIRFRLPDTGQVLCYDDEGNQITAPKKGEKFSGQDGNYAINPLSYTKLDDMGKEIPEDTNWEEGWFTVRDNNTGLIWEVKSTDPSDINYFYDRYSYEDAMNVYIKKLNSNRYGGFNDWRMPNKEELRSIVNYNDVSPALDGRFFPNILAEFYWSKDINQADKKMAWGIYFGYGCAICYLRNAPYRVVAVRGGYNPAFGDTSKYSFKDNGDGTITDLNTGLMWQKDESEEMNLEDALKYCEELKLGGYDDWRLPNMKEIPTLFNLNFTDGLWFHKKYFPDVKIKPLGFYWASTTFASTFGWGVNFQFGYDGYYAGKKHGKYPFRPVRSI